MTYPVSTLQKTSNPITGLYYKLVQDPVAISISRLKRISSVPLIKNNLFEAKATN